VAAISTRGDGVALWRQVEITLAAELSRLAPDAQRRLPTERELAARFGVNRHTVRQAVRALVSRGLVRTEQGRGMFAADVLLDYPLGPRTRFTASLEAQDLLPGREVLGTEELAADAATAAELGIERGTTVLRRRSVGLADGVPVCVGYIDLPLGRFPDARERLAVIPTITAFLESYGLADYRRRSTRVLARLPDADEARLLRQPAAEPVLVTEASDVDCDGRPVSFSLAAWAATRVQFVVGG
jgi:GntR family phosphonate transport system transcriptional regulator